MAQTWKGLKAAWHWDAGEFKKKFPDITQVIIPSLAKKGLHYAGTLLRRDAIKKKPYAPKDMGDLWRSSTITPVVTKAGGFEVKVGFNLEYAHRLHEMPDAINWTYPDSGPKYLSSKLALYADRYMKAVAETIRKKAVPGAAGGATS